MYVYVSRDVCTCISVCLVRVCVYACTQSMCYLKMAYGSNRKFSFDIRCERITRSEKFIEFLFKFITMSSFFWFNKYTRESELKHDIIIIIIIIFLLSTSDLSTHAEKSYRLLAFSPSHSLCTRHSLDRVGRLSPAFLFLSIPLSLSYPVHVLLLISLL